MRPLMIEGVSYSYDDGVQALRDVSLSLDEGEKVAVIGPNGAGKSTFLHLIAGFRAPFSGSVNIFGVDLSDRNADSLRRRIGILFQDPDDQLFMPSVSEDVAFGPRMLALDDIDGRVERALEQAGIGSLANRRPNHLSHGTKKRVAIAGVMAMEAELLLLDEPTAGLDPRSRRELIELLKTLRKPILMATHDIEAAAEVADRAILLNVGVIGSGAVRDLLAANGPLAASGLDPPPIPRLFQRLYDLPEGVSPPVTVDEAVAEFRRSINVQMKHDENP